MKKLYISIIILFILQSIISGQQYNLTGIDSILMELSERTGGCGFIAIKNGKTIYKKNYGNLKLNSRIEIASSSKWLSAAVILSLVDDDLINLDDPISKYIKAFNGDKGRITIRQLLSHTAGLPITTLYDQEGFIASTLKKQVENIARDVPLITEPGTTFYYGGVTFQIAGRIAEVVTGKGWENLFYERIGDLCSMRNTDFGNSKNPSVAAGAVSTGNDFANFLKMILNMGKYKNFKVLSEKSVAEMISNQTGNLPIVYSPYKNAPGEKMEKRYGLGVWIDKIDTLTQKGEIVSSQGVFGFSPWIDFRKNLACILVMKAWEVRWYSDFLKIRNIIEKEVN